MVAGPTRDAQLNQMTYCVVFRINYFLLVFIKLSVKMAKAFIFVLFGEFCFCMCVVFVLCYFPCRSIQRMFQATCLGLHLYLAVLHQCIIISPKRRIVYGKKRCLIRINLFENIKTSSTSNC